MTVSEYVNKTMASVPGFGIQATGQVFDPERNDWVITLSDGRRMYSSSPEFKKLQSTGLVHMDTKDKTTQVQGGKLNPELQRFIDLEKEHNFSEFLKRRDRLGQNYSQDPSNAPQAYKDEYDVEMNRRWAADFIERNPRNQNEDRGHYLDRVTKGLDQSIVDNLYRNLPEREGTTYWEDSKRGLNYLVDGLPGQKIEDYILKDPSLSQREKQQRLQELKDNPNLSRVMGGLETLSAAAIPAEFVTAAARGDYSFEDAARGVKNDTPLEAKLVMDPLNLVGVGIGGAALKGMRGANTFNKFESIINKASDVGKFLTEETVLKDAHKINPWAFKPQKGNFYRQVDEGTFLDDLGSGKIRGKQDINTDVGPGKISLQKFFGDDAYYNKNDLYYKDNTHLPYLYESTHGEEVFIPKLNGRTKKLTVDNTSVRVSKTPIDINDVNINTYKKDWLRGYKKIDIPQSPLEDYVNSTLSRHIN